MGGHDSRKSRRRGVKRRRERETGRATDRAIQRARFKRSPARSSPPAILVKPTRYCKMKRLTPVTEQVSNRKHQYTSSSSKLQTHRATLLASSCSPFAAVSPPLVRRTDVANNTTRILSKGGHQTRVFGSCTFINLSRDRNSGRHESNSIAFLRQCFAAATDVGLLSAVELEGEERAVIA